MDALADLRRTSGVQRSQTWPAWRYVTPAGDGQAVDPASLANNAWTALREFWDDAAPAIDVLHPQL